MKYNPIFSNVSFFLRNIALLLIEITAAASACNVGKSLNDPLLQQNNTLLDSFLKRFTMVNVGARVKTRVANASMLRKTDETWMRFTARFLNNRMKAVILRCERIGSLSVITEDFCAMKKIIEDANRSGWNYLLLSRYRLNQECDTRLLEIDNCSIFLNLSFNH